MPGAKDCVTSTAGSQIIFAMLLLRSSLLIAFHSFLQETFLLLKQRVLKAERALLYVLGFNLEPPIPSIIAIQFLQYQERNAFLPKEKRVSDEQWRLQCEKKAGEAFDFVNELCGVIGQLGLPR